MTQRSAKKYYTRCRRCFGSLLVDPDIRFVDDGADEEIAVALHGFARSYAALKSAFFQSNASFIPIAVNVSASLN